MNKTHPLLRAALCLLIGWLLPAACIDETAPAEQGAAGAPAGSLQLTLRIPGFPAAGAATRAVPAADESRIDRAQVLLFDMEGGKPAFLRAADLPAPKKDPDGTPGRYILSVPFRAGEFNRSYRMLVAGNLTRAALEALGGGADLPRFYDCNRLDDPMEAARRLLTYAAPDRWPVPNALGGGDDFAPFPLWGETPAFNAREGEKLPDIRLVRAVARIDVGIRFARNDDGLTYPLHEMKSRGVGGGTDGNAYFKLSSVRLYRVPLAGYIAPKDGIAPATGDTHADANASHDIKDEPRLYDQDYLSVNPDALPGIPAENCRALTRTLYVPEAQNKGLGRKQAACLVVGGHYGSRDNPETFYRIDFYDRTPDADGNVPKPTADNRIDLLRNRAYVVNITGVNGPGADNPGQALEQDNTGMTLEITEWAQDDTTGDITTDGVYTLSLDKTEQTYYADGLPADFILQTDYAGTLGAGWKLELTEDTPGMTEFYDEAGNLTPTPTAGDAGTHTLHIGLKEFPQPPGTTAIQSRRAVLTFSAGRMKTRCTLLQSSQENAFIRFDPVQMNFPRFPTYKQPVRVTVSTRKTYDLRAEWTNHEGKTVYWFLPTKDVPTPTANPTTFPDTRFKAENFFVPDADYKSYRFRPEENNEGDLRMFVFTFIASSPDHRDFAATGKLEVVQTINNVFWRVDGGVGPERNEVEAEHDATAVTAHIHTEPANMVWFFTRSTEKAPWITNLDAFTGKKQTGSTDLAFTLTPNTSLRSRTHTMQARADEPGFDPAGAVLRIVQLGKRPTLFPALAGNPDAIGEPVTGEDGRKNIYLLDLGGALTAGNTQVISITANTNWQWQWDKTVHAGGPEVTWLSELRLLLGRTFKSTINENTTTTESTGDELRVWEDAFDFAPTRQNYHSDEEFRWNNREEIPLGGNHDMAIRLRNKSDQIDPADEERYVRKLVIRRQLPSYQHFVQWPYPENENLDLHVADIQGGTAPAFKVRTNATGSLEILTSMDNMTYTSAGKKEIEAQTCYEEFEMHLNDRELNLPLATEGNKNPPPYIRLQYTGPVRETAEAIADADGKWHRTYLNGYRMVMPHRNMLPKQRFLSSHAHTLRFSFEGSVYKELRVRVKGERYNTEYTKGGMNPEKYPDTYHAATPEEAETGTQLTWPQKEFVVNIPRVWYPEGEGPAGGEVSCNVLRKLILQYQTPHDYGTDNWKEDIAPEIWQDGESFANEYTPGYIGWLVKFENFPKPVYGRFWKENMLGKEDHRWTDKHGMVWYSATPLNKFTGNEHPTNMVAANFAVEHALAAGTTRCTSEVPLELVGPGDTNWAESAGTWWVAVADAKFQSGVHCSWSHRHQADINMKQLGTSAGFEIAWDGSFVTELWGSYSYKFKAAARPRCTVCNELQPWQTATRFTEPLGNDWPVTQLKWTKGPNVTLPFWNEMSLGNAEVPTAAVRKSSTAATTGPTTAAQE